MSSVFMSDSTNGSSPPQQKKPPESTRPKRPRSSLACIRCRKKKVKCDFVQPTCGRCAIAGLPCSYATPPRRVDGHAFDQLGSHVEELKERMQKMQSELAMMKTNLHPFSSGAEGQAMDDDQSSRAATFNLSSPGFPMESGGTMSLIESNHTLSQTQQPVTWKLSLSPSGLRIDTNIASVADLYRILLNGISQLNINSDSTTSLFSTDSLRADGKSIKHKSWERSSTKRPGAAAISMDSSIQQPVGNNTGGSGRLWEVDDNEARKIIQERSSVDETLPPEKLHGLMHDCYHKCFLAYQIADRDTFMNQYASQPGLEPLLANSINAWVSKHGCIYHNTCPDKDPTSMGETYFKNARQLLKKCFDISSPITIHALLNLYMYQLSSERSSLAYLYIGLAIRMAQDLKFHKKEHMPTDPKQRETNKRLWWSAYWLDLCAALESNRPTMVDDKDCDLEYPIRLDTEDDETGYRISFCVYSIKLMKIRKDITKHLPSEQSGQSLLSAISRLENALTNWLIELPLDLRFDTNDSFLPTGSFRDEACMILSIQYQTTWIMLHKLFLPKQDQTATPVALLSLNICTKSANFITKMLDIYAENLSWCQFFYALDGVIASVTIHQVNALSNESEVATLAQRNLIVTANVLRKSPLLYMEKVNDIIESIDEFLRKNNLSTDLSALPPINEDSVNQQSISSVFHPTMFDSPQTQPPSHVRQPQTAQPQQPQSFGTSSFAISRAPSNSPTVASRISSTGTPLQSSSVASPLPQTLSSKHAGSVTSGHQVSPHYTGQDHSPIPMPSASPQKPTHTSHHPVPQSHAAVAAAAAVAASQQRPPQVAFDESFQHTMLFGNQSMANFNMSSTPSGNTMDQLLFRDTGFNMSGHPGGPGFDQFPQLGAAMMSATSFAPSQTYTSATQTQSTDAVFPFAGMFSGGGNGAAPAENSYPNFLSNPALFGLTGLTGLGAQSYANLPQQPQPQQHQQPPPQQQPQPPPPHHQQPQPQQQHTTPGTGESAPFDPSAFFGQMDFVYGGGGSNGNQNAGLYASQFGDFAAHGHPGAAGAGNYAQPTDLYAAAAATGRKRPHREWDESA